MTEYPTLEAIVLETAEMVRPPERLTVSQAAEKYRMLNNPGSYVGPWKNAKTPYLTEPMDELTNHAHEAVIFVGPAQTGKTDMVLNWLTHTALCDPADTMIIEKSQATARDFAKRRIERLFRHTQSVGDKVVPGRQNQNLYDTRFKSGWLLTLSWPTINELSGKPIPRLWLTDYDRMPEDVDGEGSPFDLARKRATTYKRFGKTVAESSPGVEVDDPKWIAATPHEAPPTRGILALYNRGDRRRWFWHCPECHEAFEPDFKLLTWPQTDDIQEAAEKAELACPHCGSLIPPSKKNEINRAGRWVKDGQKLQADGTLTGTARRSEIASFWMKGPAAAFADWSTLVANFLRATEEFDRTGSEEALKTTTNTDQGLPYVPQKSDGDRLPEELKSRAEDWGGDADNPVIPRGVRFLIATVDVQAGGRPSFVVQVHGFGLGGDCWLVDMFKIRKSNRIDSDDDHEILDPAAYLEDWDTLTEQVVERTYPLGDGTGRHMAVKMTGVDSGGAAGVTANAYSWWRGLKNGVVGHHKRVRLVKGDPSRGAPRSRESFPDSQRKDRHAGARGDVPVVFIGSNLMKDQAHSRLGRYDRPGGGMVRFPHWAENWLYTQLTAEVRTDKGWVNPRRYRNEAWDLFVYALTLTLHSNIRIEHIDWDRPPAWAEDWDDNALVVPADEKNPFVEPGKVEYDMRKLGEKLA